MALSLESIKKDFARNKKRAVILAALSVVMAGFVVKAYFEMAPRTAAADSSTTAGPAVQEGAADTLSAAETEARIKQSKELWTKLREQRGVAAPAAFTFVPSFYLMDPSKVREPVNSHVAVVPQPEPVNVQSDDEKRLEALKKEVEGKAKMLVVSSIVVGKGNSRPVAVVSSPRMRGKIVGIGDKIDEFQITAIKDRSVDFKMEGITVSVSMANSTLGGQ